MQFSARVPELVYGIALKAMAPSGACGFESHPGHSYCRRGDHSVAIAPLSRNP